MQGELSVEVGRDEGRLFVVRKAQKLTLGRGDDAEIRLRDDLVSRRHAALELKRDGLWVTDLGSRNGTYVGGRQLQPGIETHLAPGERLEVGEHVLRIDVPGLPAETGRAKSGGHLFSGPLGLLPDEEFEILAEIGRGASGSVYGARQRLSDRKVAIKVLHGDGPGGDAQDPGERERLLREGRICCRIDSPYVVRVYDVRLIEGHVFLVMELIDGPTLADRLQRGPLPLREALRFSEHVAKGLVAAHAAGVVHRDIKPGNIMIAPEKVAKIGDFGIAKDDLASRVLTASSLGLGSMAYVSPEQAAGAHEVDSRADLYSLGATLYHSLAGRPPIVPQGAPMKAIIELVERPADPIADYRKGLPEPVIRFVHSLLEKDPDSRPATAQDVATRLRDLRHVYTEGSQEHTQRDATREGRPPFTVGEGETLSDSA